MSAGWSLVDEKRALRRGMRVQRERLDPAERARAGRAAGQSLLRVPEFARARVVSAYVPTRGELDVSFALQLKADQGAAVAFPRVTAERPRLRFHVPEPEMRMLPGAFGILEPPADSREVPVEAIEVVLVPGLAFDERGGRLGYGGGYYDEAMGRLRAAGRGFLLGVGFDFQLIGHCPVGGGDVTVDAVVTDARLVRCERK